MPHRNEILSYNPDVNSSSFLSRIPLFATLSQEDLERIASQLQEVPAPRGALIFRERDPGMAFYIVKSGVVEIFVTRPDGATRSIAYLGRSETFGEMSLLTGEVHSASARADISAELLVLYKTAFDALIQEFPSIGLQLSRILSRRLALANRSPISTIRQSVLVAVLGPAGCSESRPLAANLAVSLARQTVRRVAFVDFAQEPGVRQDALGQPVRPLHLRSLAEDTSPDPDVRALDRLAVHHPSGAAVFTLPGALIERELYPARHLPRFFSLLKAGYEHIILNLPCAESEVTRVALQEAGQALVLFFDDASLDGTLQMLEKLGLFPDLRHRLRPCWLKGFCRLGAFDPVTRRALDRAEARFEGRIAFQIALDYEALERSQRHDTPFVDAEPGSLMSQDVSRLARAMGGLRLGLALGSGAAFGYAHIGVLKVLEREKIPVDCLAGTSFGAFLGSIYAAGRSAEELADVARAITRGRLWAMADLAFPRGGLMGGTGVAAFLRSLIGDVTFHELAIPFACIATDIASGEEITLSSGPVCEAVRASIGLPGIFRPYPYDGRFLVDGGLVNPVPSDLVAKLGGDRIIAVNVTSAPGQRQAAAGERGPGIFTVFFNSLYTMEYRIAAARAEVADLVLRPDTRGFTWPEFHRAEGLIRAGEACAEEALPQIRKLWESARGSSK